MTSRRLAFVAVLLTSMWSTTLFSGDGVREINQACALVGCDSGDAPGFPVFITEPGSYKLTGNLDLTTTPNTTGVQIRAPFVTLDLNGFEIVGPIGCTGSGPTIDCDSGDGSAVLIEADARAAVVRNGTVRNMGAQGIWGFSDGLTIENVRAMHNARDGLRGGANSLVINSVAIENGEDGFDFEYGSVLRGNTAIGNGDDGIEIDGTGGVVDNSTSNNNGNRGFHLAHSCKFGLNGSRENVNPDLCGGGICTSLRRYYLTQPPSLADGSQALGACESGFHMASISELWNISQLAYDNELGFTNDDSGTGQVAGFNASSGWVRTGLNASPTYNCSNWTSNDINQSGTHIRIATGDGWNDPATKSSPWNREIGVCSAAWQVWCIED